jgi:elongation factor P
MLSIGEIRAGMTVLVDGEPFLVTKFQHSKQARGSGVLKTTIKNLKTGATIPKTFQGSEKLEPANVGYFRAQFLFEDDETCTFMREDDFEQFTITKDNLEDELPFLTEGETYDIQHFEEQPINVNLPVSMIFEVVETVPGVKGDTAQGGTKPATLDNGLIVNVPLFVSEGEKVKVDTRTREFLQRVQEGG